jgi:cysteine desulfurase
VLTNRTRVYLDNAATTPLCEAVRAAMEPHFVEQFGNASSPYALGRQARMALDRARSQLANLIGSHSDEIAFTAGGTESDNWALLGVALANLESKGHIVVSAIEHHAVLEAASTLRELGFEVEFAPCDEHGVIAPVEVAGLLKPSTRLVSVMAANNETGVVQPVAEIGELCRERGVLFHCDAVQAVGKIAVDVTAWNVDMMTLSAHKINGPKGAGALFIRRGTPMRSLLRGGGQERGRRGGTENVPALVGFGAAVQSAHQGLAANATRLTALRDFLEVELRGIDGAHINGALARRAPHITNVSFRGVRAETLALNLDLQGFAVGTGSACASGAIEASHVLRAMGLDEETARASLRISLGAQNTREEIEEFVTALKNVIHHKGHGEH